MGVIRPVVVWGRVAQGVGCAYGFRGVKSPDTVGVHNARALSVANCYMPRCGSMARPSVSGVLSSFGIGT